MDSKHSRSTTPPTYEHEQRLMREARARAYRRMCEDGMAPHDALPASRDGLFELKSGSQPEVAAVAICPECFATGHVPFSARPCFLCKGTGIAAPIGGAA